MLMKTFPLLVMLAAAAALAQSGATAHKAATTHHAAATHRAATGPSKVTGAPTKTADGLEYWDIKVGTGAAAAAGDTVKVNYTGWFTNGKKFDSSIGRGPV